MRSEKLVTRFGIRFGAIIVRAPERVGRILTDDELLPMRQYLAFVGRSVDRSEVQPNSPVDMIARLVDSHAALRGEVERLTRERDEVLRSVEDQRQRIGAWSTEWSSRVANLEATLRRWQEAYWAKVPYPEWIRRLTLPTT